MAASYLPRTPVLVCRLPLVSPVYVVLSVSTYVAILTLVKGMRRASAAIIALSVRWPGPISVQPDTHCALPSGFTMTWPVAGFVPAPWLQAWAASPMPWKIPGLTSRARDACHFSFQPRRFEAETMQSRIPGSLNDSLVSGFPVSLRFLSRNSTGSIPMAYAALSIVISSAKVPLGWLTHRYGPDL